MVILVSAIVFGNCIFGGESERDLSEYFPDPPDEEVQDPDDQDRPKEEGDLVGAAYTPPVEDLENLAVAPPSARFAVQSFFHLVASGDLRSAWERTSAETKDRITMEAFEQRYLDIWAEASIGGFTWEVVPQDDENAPTHEVILRYQTTFFGEIEEIVRAQALRQPHWVVNWTPDLIFSELGSPGYLISTRIEKPPRGR
ncbi:MAG: hypothetical protein OXG42_00485, partial [Chloroflexi bacterium]|nr:hypothetical protein [Chloroflexota bacterium]